MRWAGATDALDNSVWWARKQGGTRDTEGADAATVLESRFDPLISASTLRISTGANGHREWTRRRESRGFS